MRALALIALSVALYSVTPASAQAPLPACASKCFGEAVMNQTACAPTDTPCICHNEALNQAIQGCMMQACTVKETLSAVNTTFATCGVPIKDRSGTLIITNAVFGALALIALIIRLIVSLQYHTFALDDGCALVAYIFSVPVTSGQIYAGVIGFGKDTWAVPPENIYKVLKVVYFDELSYFVCCMFSKLCFCFIFLRIFPSPHTRKFVYAGVVMSVLYPIAFGIPVVFSCKPISAAWTAWDMETPFDHCMDAHNFWFFAAAYNIATDVYVLLLPIPELIKLKMSFKKKLMLLAIFSTGIITITVSIARLWALAQFGNSTNPLYDNVLSGIFSPLELNVGICAMCMPAFRRFLVRIWPSRFGNNTNTSAKYKYRGYEENGTSNRYSTGKRITRKSELTDSTLFNTAIMKTVDTRVEETSSDDDVRLVHLKQDSLSLQPNSSDGASVPGAPDHL